MDPGALGSLGVGTGFAIAAGLANPSKEVLCYYGDGSFGMTAFDMETANRFGVPYIAVIGNNSAMNQIRYGQLAKYGEQRGNVGNLLGDVPFGKFAEMLGRIRRGSARPGADRAGPAAGPRIGAQAPQVRGRSTSGSTRASTRRAPRTRRCTSNTGANGETIHGKSVKRRTHSRFHARAVRTDLHAAAGVVRGRRDQGREGRQRRRHAGAAARHSRRRTASISPC